MLNSKVKDAMCDAGDVELKNHSLAKKNNYGVIKYICKKACNGHCYITGNLIGWYAGDIKYADQSIPKHYAANRFDHQ